MSLKMPSSFINSIFLGIYMLMTVGIDLSSLGRYEPFFEYGLCLYPFILFFIYGFRFYLPSIVIFSGGVLFCLVKGIIYLPLVYVLSAPILSHYVINKKFHLFTLYVIYGLICLIFLNASYRDALNDFMVCSRNYVSIKLLFLSSLVTLITYRQNNKILIIPAFFTLVLSLMAIGRGGILCSFINFLGIIYLKYIGRIKPFLKISIVVALCSVVLYYWSELEELYDASEQLERLREQGFEDSSREDIWSEYFSKINTSTIVTGVNFNECRLIHSFNNNPHNSYILLHAYLGIFALIPYCLILYALYVNIRRKDYVYVLPLIALLIRCFTDIALLHYYDFIILLFVFRSFELKKDKYAGITSLTSQS